MLEAAAVSGETMTYTEVAQTCGLNPRNLGLALSAISNGSFKKYRVMLLAVVVRQKPPSSSRSLFCASKGLGLDVRDRKEFHAEELARVFGAYARKRR